MCSRPCTHKSRLVSSGWSLSALPPKADIRQRIEHVCFVPRADVVATLYESNAWRTFRQVDVDGYGGA